ncbi:FHA domain-containing protein [Mesorhizobium sp.]|uniref:FHA domain-containing protein n=1 Tax=Mesorhizobium sp. TaxID=1871066 RepID=UPI0025D8B0A2|nr:FHA domain-containing protein [Mesorhizobium sp.]
MFSRVTESRMLSVRGLLLLAWFVLIASLFWDPYSAMLTDPGNLASPFRLEDHVVMVQNQGLVASPYPLGARIFWTMVVPIVPLFLMVFGHEAWRRICPLSLASQIPGYLGLRRYRGPGRGQGKRTVALLDRQSWIARNTWYVQFGFLFTGISARLLIINTDRTAMAIALLGVIGLAALTGILWGGKTWCNYFCPANIVQKIYTEPGGIFESAPHFSRPALPQSMCRKTSSKGDVSACVACTANCGDVDLQRAYWSGVLQPQRRNVYYMFFGLIIGFYGYYYLYAGNWDYYFSGIWTHESGIASKLFAPGFFILGHAIPVPKLVAAPLTLAIACGLSLAVGRGLEMLYRKIASRDETISDEVFMHRCLSVCAWLSINAFYIFGGRPNILLLPLLGPRVLDIAIISLTTIWLRRALQQSPERYQQESMASGLLAELRRLKINVSKFLPGRKLESLKANEVYLLSKVIPEFSQQQKLDAYKRILDEAVTKGDTASAAAVKLLEDFRAQMDITEEEHAKLLDELGFASVSTDLVVTAEEKATSLDYYKSLLSATIAEKVQSGASIEEILDDPEMQSMVAVLRQSLQIADSEHLAAIEALSAQFGFSAAKIDETLDAMLRCKAIRLCVEGAAISDKLGATLAALLLRGLDARLHSLQIDALSALRSRRPEPDVQRHAEDLASLAGHDLDLVLRQIVPSAPTMRWRQVLHPKIFAILSRIDRAEFATDGFAGERRTHGKAVLASMDVAHNLEMLLSIDDPLLRAIGLAVSSYINPMIVLDAAERMTVDGSVSEHSFLATTAEYIVHAASAHNSGTNRVLHASVQTAGHGNKEMALEKDFISVGRAVDNDIVVPDPHVASYHLAIKIDKNGMRLIRLDMSSVFIDGRPLQHESIEVNKGSTIALGDVDEAAPRIVFNLAKGDAPHGQRPDDGILRLAMLAQSKMLHNLPLDALASIAEQSTTERHIRGAQIDTDLENERYTLVYMGQVQLFDREQNSYLRDRTFASGELIFPDSKGPSVVAEVVSDTAILLRVPAEPEIKAVVAELFDHSVIESDHARSFVSAEA